MQSEELDLGVVHVPCQSGLPIFLSLSFFLEMLEVALAIQRPDYSNWQGLLHGCRIATTLAPNCTLEPTYLKNMCAAYVPCSPVVQMNPKARHQTQQQH